MTVFAFFFFKSFPIAESGYFSFGKESPNDDTWFNSGITAVTFAFCQFRIQFYTQILVFILLIRLHL